MHGEMLELVEDIAEFPDAGFSGDPFCGTDCADGEAFAAMRRVAEFESVGGTGGSDNVFAFGIANAVGGDLNLCAGVGGLENLAQRDGGAGGGVELGSVVGFSDVEVVIVELGEFRRHLEEAHNADGEICSVEQSGAVLRGEGFQFVEVCIPTRCAHDDTATRSKAWRAYFRARLQAW